MKQVIKKLLFASISCSLLVGCGISKYEEKTDPLKFGELKPVFEKAPEIETPIEIAGHNLALESSIDIIYYVKRDSQYANTGLLVWNAPASSYTYGTQDYIVQKENNPVKIGENYYDYYAFDGLAAKQMSNYFYAVAYVYDNGEYIYSNLDRYSVIDYAKKFADSNEKLNSESTIVLKDAIKAILNYGGTIQQLFNYNMDRCVLNPFYEVSLIDAKFDDGFDTRLCFKKETIEIFSSLEEGKTLYDFYGEYEGHIDVEEGNHCSIKLNNLRCERYYKTRNYDASDFTLSGSKLVNYCGNEKDVVVFPNILGTSITSIGKDCFKDNQNIESVQIPNSVTSIENGAFNNLSNLEVLYFEASSFDNVDYLCINKNDEVLFDYNFAFNAGDYVFDDDGEMCLGKYKGKQKIVDLSKFMNTSLSYYIGPHSFANTPIETVIFPTKDNGIIEEYAFGNCRYLKTVKLYEGKIIFEHAFENCGNLRNFYIPKGTTIRQHAFDGADGVIALQGDLEDYSELWFFGYVGYSVYNCSNSENEYVVDDNGNLLACNCEDEIVNVPERYEGRPITSIKQHAFYKMENLKEVSFNSYNISIFNSSFFENPKLENINFSNVRNIETNAFQNNPKLVNFYFDINLDRIGNNAIICFNPDEQINIYFSYPEGARNMTENWYSNVCSEENVHYNVGNPRDWELDGSTITAYKGKSSIMVLPKKVGEITVTGLAKNASIPSKVNHVLCAALPFNLEEGCLNNLTDKDATVFIKDGVTSSGGPISNNSNLHVYTDCVYGKASWEQGENIVPTSYLIDWAKQLNYYVHSILDLEDYV